MVRNSRFLRHGAAAMSDHDTVVILQRYLKLLEDRPGTVAILQRLNKKYGANAALDALFLILIKHSQHQASAFSYVDTMAVFWDNHPNAVPLLDQAISTFARESAHGYRPVMKS